MIAAAPVHVLEVGQHLGESGEGAEAGRALWRLDVDPVRLKPIEQAVEVTHQAHRAGAAQLIRLPVPEVLLEPVCRGSREYALEAGNYAVEIGLAGLAGPAVARLRDRRRVWATVAELDDIGDVRAAPLIDRAGLVVADHAQLDGRLRQQLDQPLLGRVDVLVLVDHQVPQRPLDTARRSSRPRRAPRSCAR